MMGFTEFLSASPSSFHAAQSSVDLLTEAGFREHRREDPFDASPGGHVIRDGGAVMAWWVPRGASADSPVRIIGSHTDSPGFKLKPHPESMQHGWTQLEVEVYGGPILASWFDRDLCLAGELALIDGTSRLIHTPPVARIPHVAIHLIRDNDLSLNKQLHLHPVSGFGSAPSVVDTMAELAGVAPTEIAAMDVITVDAQPPALIGVGESMLASGRLDNLSSVYASLAALEVAVHSEPESILVVACFDHEEVGSQSPTGAGGPLLEDTLVRLADRLGADTEGYRRMLARATCVSADAAHAVHPNYPEKHDPHHHPLFGDGPVTKINANQRYATTARSHAQWERACAQAGVNTQRFASRNDIPCGSTIGPITATRLGIDTVDVGIPLLSMHSARELCAPQDVDAFISALTAYLLD